MVRIALRRHLNRAGILKGSISPPSSWYIYSNSEGAGLYVLDVDYCSFGSQVNLDAV